MLRNPIRTIALAGAAVALVTVAAASSSHAQGVGVPGGGRPFVETGTIGDPMVLPALPDPAGACPFAVSFHDVYTNQKIRLYNDGSTKGTGQLVTRITNLDSGAFIDVNISGPGRTYTDSAGVFHYVLKGASLTWVSPGKDKTGTVPVGLYLRHGSADYDGDFNLLSYTGTAENLCETLA